MVWGRLTTGQNVGAFATGAALILFVLQAAVCRFATQDRRAPPWAKMRATRGGSGRPMRSLLGELRRRNVFRVGALYVAAIWALAQGIAQLGPAFGMPEWVTRWFVIAGVIGFPFWIALAWFYELTPEGLRRESEIDHTDSARPVSHRSGRGVAIASVALLSVIVAGGAWWALQARQAIAHSMTVRLAGFQLLSADLPATLRDAVDAELTAAFNADGAVTVSRAVAPAPGTAPAYALGGTIQRDGDTIHVITHVTNERSGETVWSDTFNYAASEVSRIPRRIAVDKGNVVRCGLFGASTYDKPLPDTALRDYMQFCQGHWDPNLREGRKALIPAQRVVAAVPDFSWGWAAVAGAYWKVAGSADSNRLVEEARASGREAADRAVAIDSGNSEALYIKSMLVDRHDWIGREELLKRAVAARRLDCGCEHHQYGWMLANVGRIADAIEQLHLADDMLALYVYTPLTLAQVLVIAGKLEEAQPYFDAAIDLAPTSDFANDLTSYKATELGDVGLLSDPGKSFPDELRAALLQGYRARASSDSGEKARAVAALLALPEDQQKDPVAKLLAELGANHEAFEVAVRVAKGREYPGPALLWDRRLRAILADPGFPTVAKELGLVDYWKTTHTKPDVCEEKAPPSFCEAI
jgi:tetratricopeptide (TPR) repeat protein